MHGSDELYALLRGPAEEKPDRPGERLTSRRTRTAPGGAEPVLFTVNYGAGRIFFTRSSATPGPEGPCRPPLECVGFIVTFQRGAEWAAAGKVSADFSSTNRDIANTRGRAALVGIPSPASLEFILPGPRFLFLQQEQGTPPGIHPE